MTFTFPKAYFIGQLLTIGHDCPVPEDKRECDKLPYPFDLLGGVKG